MTGLAPRRPHREELLREAVDFLLEAGDAAGAAAFATEIPGFGDTARRRHVLAASPCWPAVMPKRLSSLLFADPAVSRLSVVRRR